MKKLVIASLFVIGSVALAASSVKATEVLGEQEQSQDVTQESETTCTTSYGQDTSCTTKTTQNVSQEQRQRILAESTVVRNGQKVHIPVDTAMDTKSAATAMGVSIVGALAFITKRSIV